MCIKKRLSLSIYILYKLGVKTLRIPAQICFQSSSCFPILLSCMPTCEIQKVNTINLTASDQLLDMLIHEICFPLKILNIDPG